MEVTPLRLFLHNIGNLNFPNVDKFLMHNKYVHIYSFCFAIASICSSIANEITEVNYILVTVFKINTIITQIN